MTVELEFVQARSHGGFMPGGGPKILCIHDAETPLKRGYADSIARNWFARLAKTSAHVMVDPGKAIRMLPDNIIGWHCGVGNTRSKGYEQAGYARLSRAEWLSPEGISQMRLLAALLAEDCRRYDIPARWATPEQIREAHRGGAPAGLCTHDDMRRALGGTTHTDPTPNYPKDRLLAMVKEALAGKVATPTPPKPKPKEMTMDAEVKAAFEEVRAGQATLAKACNSILIRVVELRTGQINTGRAEDQRFSKIQKDLTEVQADLDALQAAVTPTPTPTPTPGSPTPGA